jgi:hypothetical protein
LFVSALPFSIFTGCSSPDGGDTTVTKTADVSVGANNFTQGSNALNFTPVFSFTGADAAYFNATDITYTLASTNPVVNLNSYSGVVPASLYADLDTPLFTQVFFMTVKRLVVVML